MGQLFEPTSGLRNVAVDSDSGHATEKSMLGSGCLPLPQS